MDITSGIRAWYWNFMVLKRSQINKPTPLESELEGSHLVEEELEEKMYLLLKLWLTREKTTLRKKWSIENL